MVLQYSYVDCDEGVYVRTRTDGNLFNLSRLRAKTKTKTFLVRELLFADDAALTSHSETGLQTLIDRLSQACKEFGLTISLKKTNILTQGAVTAPTITIDNTPLELVESFKYLGSTIASSPSLDMEISSRIGKAAGVMSKLDTRVWSNGQLTTATRLRVYQACVLSTLLYGSESWTTYSSQENRLNTFHLRCLRRLLHIRWQDKVTNVEVLKRAGIPSMHGLLSQRRLRWLGHVHRMEDGRIPKSILYGELSEGQRRKGRPQMRFIDVCKRDFKATNIDPNTWESSAADRVLWRASVKTGVKKAELSRTLHLQLKREQRKNRVATVPTPSIFVCYNCHRDCHSRVGLYSHSRICGQS